MLLPWLILIPFIGGFLCWQTERFGVKVPRWIALITMGLTLALSLQLWLQGGYSLTQSAGIPQWQSEFDMPWIPRFGISIHLAIDGLSLLMVVLTGLLGVLAVLCSWKEIEKYQGFFHLNLMWILGGVIGVFLAIDMFLFFFFWEMMLVPMYFLIALLSLIHIYKTHSERYNRKWDMQFAPSICQQCSIGCNISPGERYGELRRIENRYNGTVNHYFLCDRGRFGYGYVNLKDRPRQPVQRRGDDFITLNAEQAMQGAADILRQSKKVIGIGSPRASVESNFALRELVGEENFYTGIAHGEQERLQLALKVLREGGIYTPALREIESYDAVLVLGEDVTQTGARVALAVRQAVKGKAREMAAAQKVADWQIAAILNISQRAKHPLFVTNVDDTLTLIHI